MPLFNMFADISEAIRALAIQIASILFVSAQNIKSTLMDRFFSVGLCFICKHIFNAV